MKIKPRESRCTKSKELVGCLGQAVNVAMGVFDGWLRAYLATTQILRYLANATNKRPFAIPSFFVFEATSIQAIYCRGLTYKDAVLTMTLLLFLRR